MAGAHLICKHNFADLRLFALNAHAATAAQCGEAASSFLLPARAMITCDTYFNADFHGMAAFASDGAALASSS